jgi:polysaccharide export outer membrane protein
MGIGANKTIRILIISLAFLFYAHASPLLASEETATQHPETKAETPADPTYIIGPTDILEIQVWKEPDFSRQALVRPDGKITLPLIGDIHVSSMTTMALKELLTEQLKDFIESPEVTVILVESHSKNFYIIGKINRPGTYPLMKDMTVLQAISVAGGLGEWADADSIRIIRKSGGKEKILHFDYKKVISGKKLEQNIVLQPNDTIVVP